MGGTVQSTRDFGGMAERGATAGYPGSCLPDCGLAAL